MLEPDLPYSDSCCVITLRLLRKTPDYRIKISVRICEGVGEETCCQTTRTEREGGRMKWRTLVAVSSWVIRPRWRDNSDKRLLRRSTDGLEGKKPGLRDTVGCEQVAMHRREDLNSDHSLIRLSHYYSMSCTAKS